MQQSDGVETKLTLIMLMLMLMKVTVGTNLETQAKKWRTMPTIAIRSLSH